MWPGPLPKATHKVSIESLASPGHVHAGGLLIPTSDGQAVNVKLLSVEGKFVQADRYGREEEEAPVEVLELSAEEEKV